MISEISVADSFQTKTPQRSQRRMALAQGIASRNKPPMIFVSRFGHHHLPSRTTFLYSWLQSPRSIRNAVSGNRRQHCTIQDFSCLRHHHCWRERFNSLHRSLDGNLSREDSRFLGRVGHYSAKQIVGEQMSVDFLHNHVWRLCTQNAHVHRLLDRPQIQFAVPPTPVQIGNLILRNGRISDRTDDDCRFKLSFAVLYGYLEFADADGFGQTIVFFPRDFQAVKLVLTPFDDMVLFSKLQSVIEIDCAERWLTETMSIPRSSRAATVR